jgi:hypothetical protein
MLYLGITPRNNYGRISTMAKRITKEVFQERLDKDAPLKYTIIGEFTGSKKEVTVVHDVCGKTIYQKYASNLLRVKSCPHCNPENHFDTLDQVKVKLNKYNLTLMSEYKNEREKVKLKYPCGCTYTKTLCQIKAGSGVTCIKCTPRIKNLNITKDEVNARLASATYGRFKIVGEYRGTSNPTDIKCKDCGHIHYSVKPMYIERRVQGCEVCGGNVKSVNERYIKQLLSDIKVKFISEKAFDDLPEFRFDLFLPEFNLVIEYDGGFHDTCESQQQRDLIKTRYLCEVGIELLRIHHSMEGSIALTILNKLKI